MADRFDTPKGRPVPASRGFNARFDWSEQPKAVNVPSWWRTAEQQLARARELWPNAVLPEPPKVFTPATESEVLLLHVPGTFDYLWDMFEPPAGVTKNRWKGVMTGMRNMRLAPHKREFKQSVWLGFDIEHGRNIRPDRLWRKSDLAASEVLSALIQFPEWCLYWYDNTSVPMLSGYQLNYKDYPWPCVPCLDRFHVGRVVQLTARPADINAPSFSSPTVREILIG